MNAPIIVSVDSTHNNGNLPVKQLSVSTVPAKAMELFKAILPALAGYPSLHDIDLALLVEGFLAGCSVATPAVIRNEDAYEEWPAEIVTSGGDHNDGVDNILTVTSHNGRCEVHVANYDDRVWFTITLATPSNRHVVNFVTAYEAVKNLVEHAVTVNEAPTDGDKLPEVGDEESLAILWQTPYLKISRGEEYFVARCWRDVIMGDVLFTQDHTPINEFWGPKLPFNFESKQLCVAPTAAKLIDYDMIHEQSAWWQEAFNIAKENYRVVQRCGLI